MLDICLYLLLVPLLLYSSYKDIKTRRVPDWIHGCILLLAGVKIINTLSTSSNWMSILSMAAGLLFGFLTMLAAAHATKGRLGGADIKIMGVCGLLLGFERTVAAMLIGILGALILSLVMVKLHRRQINDGFALVPYLSFGICSAFFFRPW